MNTQDAFNTCIFPFFTVYNNYIVACSLYLVGEERGSWLDSRQ